MVGRKSVKSPVRNDVLAQHPASFRSLKALNRALLDSPPLVKNGGRVVVGKGPLKAQIAFVGEQPGDQEDRVGLPFVGPAGALLDEALQEAGIDRKACYVTNAVKQFIFVRRGKRRIHQRPKTDEIMHYRWWLELELRLVAPRAIVALGATALFALAGRRESVKSNRGPLELLGRAGFVTVHPASILRVPDSEARRSARQSFIADLRTVRSLQTSAKQ